MLLGTMASLGAGCDSPRPLPLVLALTPREAHSHHRHHHHHHHHLGYPHHGLSYDPIRRLALARLPPPRRPASGNKPFTSFCIRDILGGDVDKDESSRLSATSSNTSTKTSSTAGCSSSIKNSNSSHSSNNGGRSRSNSVHRPRPSPVSPPCSLPVPSSTSPKVQISAVSLNGARIVRPWAPSPGSPETEISSDDGVDNYHDHIHDNDVDDEEEISVDDDEPSPKPRAKGGKSGVSPLDALMAMTSKTFEGLEAPDAADARRDQAALFGKHAPPKKRRKSRTAFTNQQIYELEKRFLYQKYLTPADRDEIAHSLGLTNAQVITWFQNRRAKLKRDLEELKNDVTAARKHPVHKTLMGTVAELQLRKVHEEVLQKAAAAAAAGAEARREERRGQGDAITPPSSPCSLSAAVTSPSVTSPSPNPPLSVSGGLSPSASCHSNSSDGNLSPVGVCNLSASNNNHTHHDNTTIDDPPASGVNTDSECVSERVSPAVSPDQEQRVSPAASPQQCGDGKDEAEHHAEDDVEDMEVDMTEEPDEKPAASAHDT